MHGHALACFDCAHDVARERSRCAERGHIHVADREVTTREPERPEARRRRQLFGERHHERDPGQRDAREIVVDVAEEAGLPHASELAGTEPAEVGRKLDRGRRP
ncbi:MAG: hypothetical protein U0235_34390 [Polyangiaceae bacterium]